MNWIDWLVLCGTLLGIVAYGTWKTRKNKDISSYLKGDNEAKWWGIGLSIMATQASAITFLSTPGQAFEEGMGFIQFYFGMPIALILICLFVIPLYFKLKVYTAYEFLENRFDLKTRWLAASLFLISRGLSAGITIYAPAIVLSSMLGWNLGLTNLIIGTMVIIYTVAGGTRAVSQTHKLQMGVMMGGMIVALIMIFKYLSPDITPSSAVTFAGKLGKMNIVDTGFDPSSKYNLWSGLIGGLFLALSYFGTDQSQVQRYLSGKNLKEMKLGLMFNSLFKIPMQFLILFIGVMAFVFYQFNKPPMFFNTVELQKVKQSQYEPELAVLKTKYDVAFEENRVASGSLAHAIEEKDTKNIEHWATVVNAKQTQLSKIKTETKALLVKADPDAETKDGDYMFISFIMKYLPVGLVGLLLAVIFSGAMSSTSAEINALASTTMVDFYKRKINPNGTDKHYLNGSRLMTLGWGLLALFFASIASLFDNLIELVNILGSLFYGTILGIFLIGFFFKKVGGTATFIAAIISEVVIVSLFFLNKFEIISVGYLWYNLIGPALVISLAHIIQLCWPKR